MRVLAHNAIGQLYHPMTGERDTNGTVKFSWVATLFAGIIALLLGWFIATMQGESKGYLTLREHEEYVRRIEGEVKEVRDRIKEVNDRLISIETKLGNYPTRDEINNWIYKSFPRDSGNYNPDHLRDKR